MISTLCIALTACGNSSEADVSESTNAGDSSESYEEDSVYVEAAIGDVLYSDDSCSITIASLETNSDGGSTLTLSVTNNYEGSLWFTVNVYDTDEFEEYVEDYNSDRNASASSAESAYPYFSEEGETEFEVSFDFEKEYTYFNISCEKYSEFLTEDQVDSGDYVDLYEASLYYATVMIE